MKYFKQFSFKKFGILDLNGEMDAYKAIDQHKDLTKIVYLRAGASVSIDFTAFDLKQNAIFFLSAGQILQMNDNSQGTILFYNDDFYCVPLHDREVAKDELLINTVYNISAVKLDTESSAGISSVFEEIKKEIIQDDIRLEEMLRVLLKQIIIKSTRFWKHQQNIHQITITHEVGFGRYFNRLVESNFLKHHDVAAYASMLNITAKALNKRITRHSRLSPNDIIKKRIILEAKRLLAHTTLSVKEIAYKLGYDDPAYFVRFFRKQAQVTPQAFRLNFLAPSEAVA